MNTLDLKFGSVKEMLTKEQMKLIIGGVQDGHCGFSINSDCGGGVEIMPCNGSEEYCQGFCDGECDANNCCDDGDYYPD